MTTIIRAIIAASKVDPKRALGLVLKAIGVLTVATELLKAVAEALTGL